MLLNLHKKKWTDGLILQRFDIHSKTNEQTVQVSSWAPTFFSFYQMIVFLHNFLNFKMKQGHYFVHDEANSCSAGGVVGEKSPSVCGPPLVLFFLFSM